MKRYILFFLLISLSLYLLPILAILFPTSFDDNVSMPEGSTSILVYNNKNIEELPLEEYLVGVVSAEMPALYELEALKAQAVASRSYVLSKIGKGNPDHKGADVCTDPSHCSAYISPDDAIAKWGKKDGEKYLKKIQKAVKDTKGEYISYNEEPAIACFYAVSSGKTENAEDVWGGDVPYLKSVDSSEDLSYENLTETVSVPKSEALKILNIEDFTISEITKTKGGSVDSLKIGNKTFSGTEIRSLFNLNSANFEIASLEDSIIFTTKGKGHGVGMSQHGANIMAKNGKKYTEILLHYYSNVTIEKMQEI